MKLIKRNKKFSPYILGFFPNTLQDKSSVVFFRISINYHFNRYLYCSVSFLSFVIIPFQFTYIIWVDFFSRIFTFFIFINLPNSKVPVKSMWFAILYILFSILLIKPKMALCGVSIGRGISFVRNNFKSFRSIPQS